MSEQLLLSLGQGLAPIALLIVLGYIWRRTSPGGLDALQARRAINMLVMYAFYPGLAYHVVSHVRFGPDFYWVPMYTWIGLLASAGYSATEVAEVVEAVRTCSWSRGLAPTGPIGAALQDADRLDAIGAVGIVRTFATAQAMACRGQDSRFYDPADPSGQSGRPLDDRRQPVDHFYAKLLKLSQGMHTATAHTEAQVRHARMIRFLDDLYAEAQPPS